MVHLNIKALYTNSRAVTKRILKNQSFRDTLFINVQAGCGGNGLPKYGGIGGQGGSVKVTAKENISLDEVYKKNKSNQYIAKNGKSSTHNFIIGPPGEDLNIDVPVGISFYTERGKKLGEVNKDGEQLILAKGGAGGHPKNGYFGTKGQMYPVRLDLKLIADIGLVGFPNAGKSTILNAVSHARSKVASYPFTTIRPHIGIMQFDDLRRISMADLPGLIEGAYANKGMGHSFLRHVERTKLLLLVVDINGFQLSVQYPHRSCLETVMLLNKELELYNKELLQKPAVLVVNKMDSPGAEKNFEAICDYLNDLTKAAPLVPEELRSEEVLCFSDILAISARDNKRDVVELKEKLKVLLDVVCDDKDEGFDEKNADLYSDLKRKIKEIGPRLV